MASKLPNLQTVPEDVAIEMELENMWWVAIILHVHTTMARDIFPCEHVYLYPSS